MTPAIIAYLISEDIKCQNGLLTEEEQLLALFEAVSYIELAHLATKLPKGGQADPNALQTLSVVLGEVVGFANMIQQQTGKIPNNFDSLLKMYDNIFAALGAEPKVREKPIKMNLDQAREFFPQLIRRLRQATGNLSVSIKFADLQSKALFSRFITTLAERLGEAGS